MAELEADIGRGYGSQRSRIDRERAEDSLLPSREVKTSGIEVRFGEIDRDIQAVKKLFNQVSSIQHFAGVAPEKTPEGYDIDEYRENHPEYHIVQASEKELKRLYKNPNRILIVAENQSTGEIVGMATVGFPTGEGMTAASFEKLAVDEDSRGQGVARKLIRAGIALIFTKKNAEDKYVYGNISAGIIHGVEGDQRPVSAFRKEGFRFRHEARGNCVSWDNKKEDFVKRNTWNLGMNAADIRSRSDLMKFRPKEAPKTAN